MEAARARRADKGSRPRTTGSPTPRHSARATRSAGQSMRSCLLDAASEPFKAHGLNGHLDHRDRRRVRCLSEPDHLLLPHQGGVVRRGACRDILHIAERAEEAAARARTPKAYASAVVDSVVGADGLVLFVEALILARQRPDLVPQIARTIERLHVEAARAYGREMARHGWHMHHALTSRPASSGRSRSASC